MENDRQIILQTMQKPFEQGGLGWTEEKSIKWEANIYETSHRYNYMNNAKAFISNSLHIRKLEIEFNMIF